MRRSGCDVLVVGGGVAGALAAAAAGRAGARTVLVEKEAWLGGTGYAVLLQHICGLYANGSETPADTLNGGMVRETVHALRKMNPQAAPVRIGKVFVLPYEREGLRTALEELCSASGRVTVLRDTSLLAVDKQGAKAVQVAVEGRGLRQTLHPSVVVDCSGSGEAAVMAGARYELSPLSGRQLAGYIVRVHGLKDAGETLSLKVPYVLAQAAGKGALPPSARFTSFSPGAPGEGFIKMSSDDEASAERDERAGQNTSAILAVLRDALPAFRDARIAAASLKVADRESRRITGDYILTRDDVLHARKFPDGIVKNAWPIELWDRSRGTVYEYVPDGDYYEIPFRCLLVKDVPNMLTAGRCISVSREALGSTRVMGACMALGEQAGKAAAYRAKHGTWPKVEDGRIGSEK